MLVNLKQLYSKHSPIFVTSLVPLIFSVILLTLHRPSEIEQKACLSHYHQVTTFELVVAIVMSSEIFVKSIVLLLIYKLSR
jgi:hypothetical protein